MHKHVLTGPKGLFSLERICKSMNSIYLQPTDLYFRQHTLNVYQQWLYSSYSFTLETLTASGSLPLCLRKTFSTQNTLEGLPKVLCLNII